MTVTGTNLDSVADPYITLTVINSALNDSRNVTTEVLTRRICTVYRVVQKSKLPSLIIIKSYNMARFFINFYYKMSIRI